MKLSSTIKTIALLFLLSVGYYFFSKSLLAKEKLLAIHYANLVQNKVTYTNLAKLNPKDSGFDIQKSNLIGIIKETNKKGLEKPLNNAEKEIFTRQNAILDKVFATKSYEDGLIILKSSESVTLLTDQTKLIEKLKESPVLHLGWPSVRSK